MQCEQATSLLTKERRLTLMPQERETLDAHLEQCPRCTEESLSELLPLLDRELIPSPQARARFMAQLQLQALPETQGAPSSTKSFIALFQSLWPARPIGALSYSAVLLVAGLLGGQLLPPHSFGLGVATPQVADQQLNRERANQTCALPPPPRTCLGGLDC